MRPMLLIIALLAFVAAPAHAQDKRAQKTLSGAALEQAMAEYRNKMKECTAAREKHEAVAVPYWERIDAKRKSRVAKRRSGETIQLTLQIGQGAGLQKVDRTQGKDEHDQTQDGIQEATFA